MCVHQVVEPAKPDVRLSTFEVSVPPPQIGVMRDELAVDTHRHRNSRLDLIDNGNSRCVVCTNEDAVQRSLLGLPLILDPFDEPRPPLPAHRGRPVAGIQRERAVVLGKTDIHIGAVEPDYLVRVASRPDIRPFGKERLGSCSPLIVARLTRAGRRAQCNGTEDDG